MIKYTSSHVMRNRAKPVCQKIKKHAEKKGDSDKNLQKKLCLYFLLKCRVAATLNVKQQHECSTDIAICTSAPLTELSAPVLPWQTIHLNGCQVAPLLNVKLLLSHQLMAAWKDIWWTRRWKTSWVYCSKKCDIQIVIVKVRRYYDVCLFDAEPPSA